jgi:hypothetical protein
MKLHRLIFLAVAGAACVSPDVGEGPPTPA